MKMDDQDLKKLYRSSVDHGQNAEQECPDADMMIQSFSPNLGESEKYRLVDHISECPLCSQKFAIVRQVISESKKMTAGLEGMSLSEEETEELKKIAKLRIKELKRTPQSDMGAAFKLKWLLCFWKKPVFRYGSAIAGLVILTFVVFHLLKAPHLDMEDTVRGVQDDMIQLTHPKGDLSSVPRVFEWNPEPGAMGYQVVLLDEELSEVWISEKTQKTTITLPQSRSEAIKSAKIYYWKIIVFMSDGSSRESGLQDFEIKID